MSQTSETLDTLRAQLQQQTITHTHLLEITQAIGASSSLDALLHAIRGAAQAGLQADGACIVLGDTRAERGYGAAGDPNAALGLAGPMLLSYLAEHGPLEVPDMAANTDLDKLAFKNINALIVQPLIAHGKRYGIIAAAYTAPHVFTEDERVFLSIAAGQTAVAVENAGAYDRALQNQAELAAVLESSAEPVVVVDAQETIVLLNPAAERVFSVAPQTAVGKRFDAVINAEPLLTLLRQPANSELLEWQSDADQIFAPRIFEISAPGVPRRALILQDITHYKTLLANQTEFISTVSHDLRSPLTYMQGYATMLPMFGELNVKQKDAADKIVGGVSQMTDLVDKILDAGRLNVATGTYELMREPCDVSKMANEVTATHVQPAEKKGLKLIADIDQTLPVLNLDEMMLRRALNNLIDNAVKYTPDNGTITVGAHIRDKALVFSVRDSGAGISADDQKRLFKLFIRLRNKGNQKIKGSGLGLFIVKSLAQKHGGDAWVESTLGEGSTFFIRIPIEGANLIGAESKAEKKIDQV